MKTFFSITTYTENSFAIRPRIKVNVDSLSLVSITIYTLCHIIKELLISWTGVQSVKTNDSLDSVESHVIKLLKHRAQCVVNLIIWDKGGLGIATCMKYGPCRACKSLVIN